MDSQIFIQQLESIIKEYQEKRNSSKHDDASDTISNTEVRQFQVRAIAAIERTAGKDSVYFEKANSVLHERGHSYDHLASIIGITESLLLDVKAGYMKSFEELIHADIFSVWEKTPYFVNLVRKTSPAPSSGTFQNPQPSHALRPCGCVE